MVAALLVLLLAAPAPPEIPIKTGAPIRFDGLVEQAEWADAWSVEHDRPGGGKVRFRLKRTGPWLAIGIDAEKAYGGEILRVFVTDGQAAWITNLTLGLGQPTLSPAAWRRGSPERFDATGAGAAPRACLVRLDLAGAERWSAEALVRLGALGIGRGDLRELRGLFVLVAYDPAIREVFHVPEGTGNPRDPSAYGRLVSEDGWGGSETWPPISPEESKEFDDLDLLQRLCLEHAKIEAR